MKHIFCALTLFTLLAPAMAQTAPPFDKIPPAKPLAVTMKSGIVVTPILVPDDDLRSMLDVHMWSFAFKAPADGATPSAHLELRVPGQKPKVLGLADSGVLEKKSTEFLVGIAPENGTSLKDADNWKFYFRTKVASNDQFRPSVSLKAANPFQDLEFQSSRYNSGAGYALPKTNGDIPLISLYKLPETFPGEPRLAGELVLVLSVQTPQPTK